MPLHLVSVTYPGTPGQPVTIFNFPTLAAAKAFEDVINARVELNARYRSTAPRALICPSIENAEYLSPDSDLTTFRDPEHITCVGQAANLLGGHVSKKT